MANGDIQFNIQLLVRWLHVIAGITWIGHLYFFNFVNANVQPKLDGPTKKLLNPQLMPRALFWFRWGAMVTMIAGLYLFFDVYLNWFMQGGSLRAPDGNISERAMWIMLGMTFGLIMWFNVWFIIWPNQKKIQAAIRDGVAPDAAKVKLATNASKVNTYLSAPMLFGMLAPAHYGSFNAVTGIVAIALGLLAIWAAYRGAPKAAASFATDGEKK